MAHTGASGRLGGEAPMGNGVKGTGLQGDRKGPNGLIWQDCWPRGHTAWAEHKSDRCWVPGALSFLALRSCEVIKELSVFLKHLRGPESLRVPRLSEILTLVPVSLPTPPPTSPLLPFPLQIRFNASSCELLQESWDSL